MVKRIFKWEFGLIPLLAVVFLLVTLAFAGTAKKVLYGLQLKDQTALGTPPSGWGYIYVNSDILYFKTDGGVATDLISAASTATDFELAADADAGDFDIDSLDRLEFLDNGLYIDGGTDGVLLISSDGTLELASADWDISTTGVITNASMSADQISSGNLTLGNVYLSLGTDPADAGTIRLPNAGSILFEKAVTGVDINALEVDSGDLVQIGKTGASGVTITPALTLSSTLALGGDVTVGAHDLVGTTGLINYTYFDVAADGDVTCVDLTASGTVSIGTLKQDALVPASAAPSNITLDAATSGTVTIAGTSTGTIWLGDNSGGATLVTVGDGTDLLLGEGVLTIDNDQDEDALVITSSATTASAIEITNAATTTGKMISANADDLGTAGVMLYLDTDNIAADNYYIGLYDGSGSYNFSVSQYGAVVIEGNASTDVLTLTAGDLEITAGDIDLNNGNLAVDTIQDLGHNISRNYAGVGGSPCLTVTDAHTSTTNSALTIAAGGAAAMGLKIDQTGTGDATGIDLNVAGDYPAIDIDASVARDGDVIDILMTNMLDERALNITGAITGTAGEGVIEVHATGNIASTATLLRLDADTGTPAGTQGFMIYVEDDTSAQAGAYAVEIDSNANEALKVTQGKVYFVEDFQIDGDIDINNQVDIGLINNADEVMITAAANDYASNAGVLIVRADTAGGQANNTYLLALEYNANGDTEDHYIVCRDNSYTDVMFKVENFGATTITGNASGTDALTLTAGDILVTSGHIDITTGNLTVATGNIGLTTGNLQTDVGHAAIGIGTADIETWETSTQLSALQVGGAGFWAVDRVQANSDSSYFGHNAYFDDTDSQWEAISTAASDEAVMLQMTDGTWIFNVEDTELAGDAAITWIPSLIITDASYVGAGPATAAAVRTKLDLTGGVLSLQSQTDGTAIVDTTSIGEIEFYGDDDTATADEVAGQIEVIGTGTWTDGTEDAKMVLNAANDGTLNVNQLVLETDGTVSGDPWNNQRSYIMAGRLLDTLSDPLAIWAWITPATTEQDLTIENHDATYQNMETTDQTAEAMVWSLELGGTDEYLTVADHADFTFLTGADDNNVSFGGWVEIYADANVKTIIAKYDDTNSQLEWDVFVDAAEKLNLRFYDESAGATAYEGRITDAAISAGWHFFVITYATASQAEAASDGMLIYIDGAAVASSTDDGGGTYVDKEDGAQPVWIGAQGENDAYGNGWVGEMGVLFIEQATLTAGNIHKLWIQTRGYYNK